MQTKDKFDRPVFGELLGAYIREKKRFNSQSFKPIFISFFPIIKHVSRHLSRRARCEICSKLTIRIRIPKVNDKVKTKDIVDVVLASLLLTLNTFHFLLQCFHGRIWSVNCRLGFLFVVLTLFAR